jgi:class 3 adenylate cyclase/pimeloyl-ACP methyl ester carboxylesterase
MKGVPTRFARRGGRNLAYQIVGEGERSVVFEWTTFISIDLVDDHPPAAAFLERLSRLGRVLVYDRYGIGLSDPVTDAGEMTQAELALDLLAIADDAGIAQMDLVSELYRTPVALEAAVAAPVRFNNLVLIDPVARVSWAPDFPLGRTERQNEELVNAVLAGTASTLSFAQGPSDPVTREWFDRAGRHGASPRTAQSIYRSYSGYDTRELLAQLQVRTLVVERSRMLPSGPSQARWIADWLEDVSLVSLAPELATRSWYELADELLDPIERFLTGVGGAPPAHRVLATLLFTDVVGSTQAVAELGDERWQALLTRHDELLAEAVRRHDGTRVVSTGDGVLARFPGPSAAVACARSVRAGVAELGLQVRAAVHAGEVEQRDSGDIAGLTVHVASRLLGVAGPGEIVISQVAAALLAGIELDLRPGPSHQLRDIAGTWPTLLA